MREPRCMLAHLKWMYSYLHQGKLDLFEKSINITKKRIEQTII